MNTKYPPRLLLQKISQDSEIAIQWMGMIHVEYMSYGNRGNLRVMRGRDYGANTSSRNRETKPPTKPVHASDKMKYKEHLGNIEGDDERLRRDSRMRKKSAPERQKNGRKYMEIYTLIV